MRLTLTVNLAAILNRRNRIWPIEAYFPFLLPLSVKRPQIELSPEPGKNKALVRPKGALSESGDALTMAMPFGR